MIVSCTINVVRHRRGSYSYIVLPLLSLELTIPKIKLTHGSCHPYSRSPHKWIFVGAAHPSCNSPNTSWRLALGASIVSLVGENTKCSVLACDGLWSYDYGHAWISSTPPPAAAAASSAHGIRRLSHFLFTSSALSPDVFLFSYQSHFRRCTRSNKRRRSGMTPPLPRAKTRRPCPPGWWGFASGRGRRWGCWRGRTAWSALGGRLGRSWREWWRRAMSWSLRARSVGTDRSAQQCTARISAVLHIELYYTS